MEHMNMATYTTIEMFSAIVGHTSSWVKVRMEEKFWMT